MPKNVISSNLSLKGSSLRVEDLSEAKELSFVQGKLREESKTSTTETSKMPEQTTAAAV